jgi:hypothetical protein
VALLVAGCEVEVTPMEPGRDDLSVDDFGGDPHDVVVDPAGCAVVVGRMYDGYGSKPGSWRSADCARFVGDAPPSPPPWPPSEDRWTFDAVVARPGGGFVAAGERDRSHDELVADIVVRTSADGEGWEAAAAPAATDDYQHATGLLLTAEGTWLLVGGEGSRALVWRSADLATWEAVELPARAGEADPMWERASQVVQAADGRLVVVGSSTQTVYGTDEDAAAWVSTDDGATWTAAAAEGAFAPTVGSTEAAYGVVARPDGTLVALGRLGYSTPALWSSADGLHWAPLDASAFPAGAGVGRLVFDGDALLALGSVAVDGGRRGAVWRQPLGGAWTETRLTGVGGVTDAAPIGGDRVVVVGGDGYGKAWSAVLTFDAP